MEQIIINPKDYQEQYIKNLNDCFNDWGGDLEYEWSFARKIGVNSSDLLLIENKEDGVIAGSAVSYRALSNGEKSIDIGIMTGSWTLPAARRKGCFTKMINSSKDLCRQKDVPFLTAFVTEMNPSSRRLEAEGSYMFPTYHLFSPEIPFEDENIPEIEISDEGRNIYKEIYDTVQAKQSTFLNFRYTLKEFIGQYLDRIKQTTVLKINDDFAVLENGVNEMKVLLLTYSDEQALNSNIKAVTNWCLKNRSKKAFFFTTRKEVYETAKELGCKLIPGYFTILSSTGEDKSYEELFDSLNINMADKM